MESLRAEISAMPRAAKVAALLLLVAIIFPFIKLFTLANSIESNLAENEIYLSQLEKDPSSADMVGVVKDYRPLFTNERSGLIGYASTRTGTVIELDNGTTIGLAAQYDSIKPGLTVRKSVFKESKVYCLIGEKVECSFERKVNSI